MKIQASKQFKKMLHYYQLSEDFKDGPEKIKFGPRATKWLPPSSEMLAKSPVGFDPTGSLKKGTNRFYDLYRERAEIENYPEDVLGKLLGKLFLKPPLFKGVRDAHQEIFSAICHDGCDENVLIARAASEYMRNQHGGLLIGWTKDPVSSTLIPKVQVVPALNFIKPEFTWDEKRESVKLSGIWIKTTENLKDEGGEEVDSIIFEHRFLDFEDNPKGVYTVEVYHPIDLKIQGEGQDYKLVSKDTPECYSGTLDHLPFEPLWPASVEDGSLSLSTLHPLMIKTISLYRNSANYEKALCEVKFTYLVKGYEASRDIYGNDADLVAGGEFAWSSEGRDFDGKILEPSGTGITHLRSAMEDKRKDIENLSMELANAKSALPTATQAILLSTETGYKLAAASMALSGIFTRLLVKMSQMFALSPDIEAILNKEFAISAMDASTANAWASLFEKGTIGASTLVSLFERGGIYDEDVDLEDEESRLVQRLPGLLR